MSQIDDTYIEEACTENAGRKEIKNKARRPWTYWAVAVAALLAICIGVGSLANGFRSGASSASDAVDTEYSTGSYGINFAENGATSDGVLEEYAEAESYGDLSSGVTEESDAA